jgi:hypothetical protein
MVRSMTESAAPVTRQSIAARDRSLPGRVTGRLRRAILQMVWAAARRDVAAQTAGMTPHSLRAALRKRHVIEFYRGELEVLRESERARNISALVDVRDASSNAMARVNAARTLEQLAEDNSSHSPLARGRSPGVVIQIVNAAPVQQPSPSGPLINVTPPSDP